MPRSLPLLICALVATTACTQGGGPRGAAALAGPAHAAGVSSPSAQPGSLRTVLDSPSAVLEARRRALARTAAPKPAVAPAAPAAPITLAFGGDVHAERIIRTRLDRDPASVVGPISPVLARADLAMVNVETALTTRGTAEPKQYVFRAPASLLRALRASGVDVATVANNHGMDYGPVGLADTLAAERSQNFPLVGVGANKAEAYSAWRTTVRGTSVSVLGASQVLDSRTIRTWSATPTRAGLASAYDEASLVAAVKREAATSKIVVVYLHWGVERQGCPSDKAKRLAEALRAAGAEIVVGSHAHILLGEGFLGGTYIHYGLGNFVWYTGGAATGVLTLRADPRTGRVTGSEFVPAVVRNGQPIPTGASRAQTDRERAQRRACTNLSTTPR